MPSYQPDACPTVMPRLLTHDVAGLTAFIRQMFGATATDGGSGPTEVRLGDSLILVSDGGGRREPACGFLYVYVPDADAVYERAVAAGCEIAEAPINLPWGDRRTTFRDRWGNTWQAATRQR